MVILSCATFAEVTGRKCYICSSTDSFSTCDESKKEIDCSTLLPGYSDVSCAKLSYTLQGISAYQKGCLPESSCKDVGKACKGGSNDCKIYCCNSDLCNKGAGAPLISGILILTSVVLTVFVN